MMKIRTAITVMSPIMSKDKKAFLIYSTGIWTFCQRLFCNVSVNRNSAEI